MLAFRAVNLLCMRRHQTKGHFMGIGFKCVVFGKARLTCPLNR